jgi:D-xylulose kinase
MEYVLSVDLGTSAIKTALFDAHGKLIASSNQEYTLLTPSALVVEMEVDRYWTAFKRGVQDVLDKIDVKKEAIKALGISAQGETLILIDESGKPLRNAIVWMDSRAQQEAEHLSEMFKDQDVYGTTGQVSIVPTWPASKVYWVKKHEQEIFEKVNKYLLIEDYFIYRLTGRFAAEGSLLCSTVYWDITKKTYWREMLEALGITQDQLPPIFESGTVIGTIVSEVAVELGLSSSTAVCTGVLDQVAGAIGVGNVKPGVFSESTGSALAIVATVDHPFKDAKERMPCHYHGMPDTYMAHTFTTGGMVMKWFRDKFCECEIAVGNRAGIDPYTLMEREARNVTPGADGLLMLPHLQGAMAPENNPKARGVFYGMTLTHTRAHFVRAIMEGISFILRRNLEVIEELGIDVPEIRSLGGGARSEFWAQLKADITGKPVIITKAQEEACLGAAIVAGAGVGIFKDLQEASIQMVEIKARFEPNLKNTDAYDAIYRKYIELYKSLESLFQKEGEV